MNDFFVACFDSWIIETFGLIPSDNCWNHGVIGKIIVETEQIIFHFRQKNTVTEKKKLALLFVPASLHIIEVENA